MPLRNGMVPVPYLYWYWGKYSIISIWCLYYTYIYTVYIFFTVVNIFSLRYTNAGLCGSHVVTFHFFYIYTLFASVPHRIHDQGWRRIRYPDISLSQRQIGGIVPYGIQKGSIWNHIFVFSDVYIQCFYFNIISSYQIHVLLYYTKWHGIYFVCDSFEDSLWWSKAFFLVSYPKVMPSRSLRGGSRDSLHGRSWSVTGQLKVSTVGLQKKDWYRESDVRSANFWSSNSGFLLFICGSLFNAYVVFVDHSFNNEFYDNDIMFNRFLVRSVCMVGVFGGQLMAVRSS